MTTLNVIFVSALLDTNLALPGRLGYPTQHRGVDANV
jgi:hypothetical protein